MPVQTHKILPLKSAKREFMISYLHAVLAQANGRTGAAARIAGWSVPNFCQLLRRYGIKAGQFR